MKTFKTIDIFKPKPVDPHVIRVSVSAPKYDTWDYTNYVGERVVLTFDDVIFLHQLGYDFRYQS